MYNVYIVYYKDVLWLGMRMLTSLMARNDLFFFTHIIIKNDIYPLYIISKQQQQRSSKSKAAKAKQTTRDPHKALSRPASRPQS